MFNFYYAYIDILLTYWWCELLLVESEQQSDIALENFAFYQDFFGLIFSDGKYLSLLILLLWMLAASSKKKETQNKVEKLVTGTGTFECVLDLYEGL